MGLKANVFRQQLGREDSASLSYELDSRRWPRLRQRLRTQQVRVTFVFIHDQ